MNGPFFAVLRHLRRAAAADRGELSTDGELLERFIRLRDETAFEGLVQRHGPMVLGLCRRLLHDPHEAEDAFQATFVVLVRKAASISRQNSVGSWLYGVAHRVARRARGRAERHRVPQGETVDIAVDDPLTDLAWRDLRPVLDEEVRRLPEKYRAPIVLCYLEGKSTLEAAAQLGLPEGTLKVRKSRARDLLRGRLSRRGLALLAGALELTLSARDSTAVVPRAFLESTLAAGAQVAANTPLAGALSASVAALVQGVLREMSSYKLALLSVGAAVLVLVGLTFGLSAAPKPAPSAEPATADAPPPKFLARVGSKARAENTIALGLNWLAVHQAEDGHWAFDGPPEGVKCNCAGFGAKNDVAATALALLAFLGAGETHKGTREFSKRVDRALKYLLERQASDGGFGPNPYSQALATLALSEAYGLTQDPTLKAPAQRGVTFILNAQQPESGWAPERGKPAETELTLWNVMALKSGQIAGLAVPAKTWFGVTKLLDKVGAPNGSRYGQSAPSEAKSVDAASKRTTAAGLLCRTYLGWGVRAPAMVKGMAELRKAPPSALAPDIHCLYWTTSLLHHQDDTNQPEWVAASRKFLLESQDRGDEVDHSHQRGSWSAKGDEGAAEGGRLLTTSLALLTLEAYYRHLPLMRRDRHEIGEVELLAAWQILSNEDRGEVQGGLWTLVVASDKSIPFLRERLRPATRLDRGDLKELDRLLRDLNGANFEERQKAAAELEAFGDQAVPALRKTLEGKPSLDMRQRVEALLEQSAERLRTIRALEVLEEVGSSDARDQLERLVREGKAEAPLTREAIASLDRLAKE